MKIDFHDLQTQGFFRDITNALNYQRNSSIIMNGVIGFGITVNHLVATIAGVVESIFKGLALLGMSVGKFVITKVSDRTFLTTPKEDLKLSLTWLIDKLGDISVFGVKTVVKAPWEIVVRPLVN